MSSIWMRIVISSLLDQYFWVYWVVCSALKSLGSFVKLRELGPMLGNSDSVNVWWAWVYHVKTFLAELCIWFVTLLKNWLVRQCDFDLWDVIKLVGRETDKGIGIIFQLRTYPGSWDFWVQVYCWLNAAILWPGLIKNVSLLVNTYTQLSSGRNAYYLLVSSFCVCQGHLWNTFGLRNLFLRPSNICFSFFSKPCNKGGSTLWFFVIVS